MDVYLNDRFVSDTEAVVSLFDRGFLYGDGLFETLRISHGSPFRWDAHWLRLAQGSEWLGIKLPAASVEVRRVAHELIERNQAPECLLRITVSRGPGRPGYSPASATKPTFALHLNPLPPAPEAVRLSISSLRLTAGDPLNAVKSANKLRQVLARAEADAAGADETLLLNTAGEVTEGASSNIFWFDARGLNTSPVATGALPGITRMVVFEIAQQRRVPVCETRTGVEQLFAAHGVFLSQSGQGIVAVHSLEDQAIRRSAEVISWQEAYASILDRETRARA
jgi:branched-chain amino acid aminotransferase